MKISQENWDSTGVNSISVLAGRFCVCLGALAGVRHLGGSSMQRVIPRRGKRRTRPCLADMLHVVIKQVLYILQSFVGALHTSALIRVRTLIGETAWLLSTWQRSLSCSESVALVIQGAACCLGVNEFHFKAMDSKDDDKKIPSFDGKLDAYREYRRRALLYYHGLEDSKQSLAAPRLIAALTGPAFECFRERDPGNFRNTGGVQSMLDILDARFQYTPEQELSEWMEILMYRLRRHQGEETTSFTTRFETTLLKVEELVTEEMKLERRRQQDLLRMDYRRQSLDYVVAQQQHQAVLAGLAEGQPAPTAPVPPMPPTELPQVDAFHLPEVLKGFLYLRHVGISLQTRASLLRSAGGSLRFDKVADLLRKTELDSLVASKGAKVSGHGYFADVDNPSEDPYDDDFEDDYEDNEEEFGGYAEDEEEELGEDDADLAEDDAGDEDYNTAMIGYLEARKKLLSLRKARGFRDPPEAAATKGQQPTRSGKDKGQVKGTRPRTSAYPGRVSRGDFQWKPGSSATSRPSSQSRGKGGQRRPKGQGRHKGAGRRSSSSRRGDPNGSQYLGWATSAPTSARSSSEQVMLAEFQPEFSFMASAFPRNSVSITESVIDRCLMWDTCLCLEAGQLDPEQACLAVPPGHAIVDTGCTSTLVGSESERLWSEELSKQTGGTLRPERGPSDVKFEGINGEARATCQVKYPVKLGGRDGFIKASVIPGKAPFLLSIQALRQMRAKLDCENDTLEIPGIGLINLAINSVGHYMLPLFGFKESTHVKPSLPPGLSHGLSAAAEDKPGGPEDEEFVEEVSRRGRQNPQEPSSHPPVPCETFKWKPNIAEVSKRTDKLARGALLRLARDTRGPWVQLPQELATVHLILGRHGFVSPDSADTGGSDRLPVQGGSKAAPGTSERGFCLSFRLR